MQNICNGAVWPHKAGRSIVNAKYCKWIAAGLFFLSIAVTLAHAVWYLVPFCSPEPPYTFGLADFLVPLLLPYGVPVLTFALVWRALCRAQPRWCAADTVLGILFSLSFLAMAVHATVEGIVGRMVDVYPNLPFYYLIALGILAFVWLVVRVRPGKGAPVTGKVLYALPVAALAAMAVHCIAICIAQMVREGGATGAPSWAEQLLCVVAYLAAALVLLAVYGVYCLIRRRKNGE